MNNKFRFSCCVIFFLLAFIANTAAQHILVKGKITNAEDNEPVVGAVVYLEENTSVQTMTNNQGLFVLKIKKHDNYTMIVNMTGFKQVKVPFATTDLTTLDIKLQPDQIQLEQITIEGKNINKTLGIQRLDGVDGTNINEGKKNEVIVLKDLSANLATNNPRQIFAKVPGLNVWESDGAGLQLSIGGRGLSPNRSANFNVRQNGYDISADALGYPESYYTPPSEALEKIELIRGASSLQYGTQFGGMLNFVMKQGNPQKKIELTHRNTFGSWQFWNNSTSVSGQVGKLNYYTFYQHKQGNGWRPNSEFNQNTAFLAATYAFTQKLKVTFNYTYMGYLAKQPGGITDAAFEANARQSVRDRNWFDVGWSLPSLSLNYEFNKNTVFNIRTFSLMASRQAIGNLGDVSKNDTPTDRLLLADTYLNFGMESRLLHRYKIGSMNNVALVGIRTYRGNTSRKQGFGNALSNANFDYNDKNNPELSAHQLTGENLSAFFEHIFYISKKLSFTPGARYEYIKTGIDGYFNERVTNLSGALIATSKNLQKETRPRQFLLWGIGVSYKIDSTRGEIYANATQNYRAVTYSDVAVFNPNLQIDPNLKDERGYSLEVGYRGHISNIINFDIGLFNLVYNEKIGTILNTQNKRYRTNIGKANIYGTELFGEIDFLRLFNPQSITSLSYFTNLALINATYETEQKQINGKRVELVPAVNWRTGFTFRHNRFVSTLSYAYMSDQFTEATNASVPNPSAVIGLVPSYYVADLSVKYVRNFWSLEASCNNITDNRYYTRRADGYPGPGILPADARSYFVTLGIKL